MGLFSNPCKNPDCDARVKKAAHFCSRCGYAGPESLTKCPQCGRQVGRTSRFCWSCGADIADARPPRIAGDRWVRDEEEFAVRVYPADLDEQWLSKRITVEAGTTGMVEKNGKIIRDVAWGTETLDSILRITAPTSIMLISAADAVLRPTFRRLRDANGAELDVRVQLVFRVRDYESFVRQFFEGHKRRVTYSVLEESIAHELHDVVRGLMCAHALEEMYGNLTWRDQLEENLRAAMTVTLDRYGLDLLQLNFVDFGGDDFEQVQRDRGEIFMGNHAADHLAEKLAIRRRMNQLDAQGELAGITQDKELEHAVLRLNNEYDVKAVLDDAEREETIAQCRQELAIKKRLRLFEVEDLDRERAQRIEEERMAREQELERIQVAHQHEIALTILVARNKRVATEEDFRREQQRLDSEQARAEAWKHSEQQRRNQRADAVQHFELVVQQSKANLEVAHDTAKKRLIDLDHEREKRELDHDTATKRQQRAQGDREHQVAMLERMQTMERENLLAMRRLDLEEKRIDLDYKRFETEKRAEVQLASIEGNVKIAAADERLDAATAKTEAAQLRARLEDQKDEKEALRGDADRRADDLLDLSHILTKNQPQQQPGVVVVGQGGAQTVGVGESPCPKCLRPVPHNASFCPWCNHPMQP